MGLLWKGWVADDRSGLLAACLSATPNLQLLAPSPLKSLARCIFLPAANPADAHFSAPGGPSRSQSNATSDKVIQRQLVQLQPHLPPEHFRRALEG